MSEGLVFHHLYAKSPGDPSIKDYTEISRLKLEVKVKFTL